MFFFAADLSSQQSSYFVVTCGTLVLVRQSRPLDAEVPGQAQPGGPGQRRAVAVGAGRAGDAVALVRLAFGVAVEAGIARERCRGA